METDTDYYTRPDFSTPPSNSTKPELMFCNWNVTTTHMAKL